MWVAPQRVKLRQIATREGEPLGNNVSYWKERAATIYACSDGQTSNLAQNQLITKAYAQLYLSNSKLFKWAGLAAFASRMVGLGIMGGKLIDITIDTNARQEAAKLESSRAGLLGPKVPKQRINATNLDNMLIEGNRAIFRDLYWQHLAYRAEGLEASLAMLRTQTRSQVLLEAWKMMDSGAKKSHAELIWHGNQQLAFYEQWVVLQQIYDRYAETADGFLSWVMISPLPDDFRFFKADHWGGSFRHASTRWQFIVQRVLPQWRKLEANGTIEIQIQMFAMGQLPKPLLCMTQ